MIGIIDYKAGNLHSLIKAFTSVGKETTIINSSEDCSRINALCIPGVGSFGSAMKYIDRTGLSDVIRNWIHGGKPFLGICLGMQLLFEKSEESPEVSGLGILEGDVVRFNVPKVPHMGWNIVTPTPTNPLLSALGSNVYFYFVHSYYVMPRSHSIVSATSEHFTRFPAMISYKNISGIQFHPEKSGERGLELLRKWSQVC